MLISRALLCLASIGIPQSQAQTSVESPASPEAAPAAWDVSLLEPLEDQGAQEPSPSLPLASSEVISSHTIDRSAGTSEIAEDLLAVSGKGRLTVQFVESPALPEPQSSPSVQLSDGSLAFGQLVVPEVSTNETKLVFVSACVYDSQRTFLRIYPHGQTGKELTAWSNIDFNAFDGWSVYRVNNIDGSWQDYGLLVSVENVQTALPQAGTAIQQDGEASAIPSLPDLAVSGPRYQLVGTEEGCPALSTLQQIHDLFKKQGDRIVAASAARKQANAIREAARLVDPPEPPGITIRYWKGEANEEGMGVEK